MKLSNFNNSNNKNRNKKFADNFASRLEKIETKKGIKNKEREETDSEKEWKCAELRHERVMKLAEIIGYEEALSHWRDGITDYELKWELKKALRVPPEVRYQRRREEYLGHESCWTARKIKTGYDGYGCNQFTGCISSCRFYPATGRIEDSAIIKEHEERNKKEKERREEEKRKLGFNDSDNDDIKKQRWQEIQELKSRILDQQLGSSRFELPLLEAYDKLVLDLELQK